MARLCIEVHPCRLGHGTNINILSPQNGRDERLAITGGVEVEETRGGNLWEDLMFLSCRMGRSALTLGVRILLGWIHGTHGWGAPCPFRSGVTPLGQRNPEGARSEGLA